MDLTENPGAFQKFMQINLENFLPVEALKA
ncbi:hypothetical protein OESDEN_18204 [Oesophagostomum dentatum]|uniref:Uncharacterized protein n=1 Tax=Oesophagostomum dentatum TaxID=61180 RepID=A0A0B1S9Z5_OESDE|nr:hypothetical protein OESDEN_18204 [Oesophagostomum dentatum]